MTAALLLAVVTGVAAGSALGYVLQRGQLCFHSAARGALHGAGDLARAWLLGVAIAAVGLAVLYLLPGTDGLNRGLALRPVANLTGGMLIGVGMAVARSCVSGLFFKLGSGMAGAAVGLLGWAGGELLAQPLRLPGPTLLAGGDPATVPGVLGLPRLPVALVLLVGVCWWLRRRHRRARGDDPDQRSSWQWVGPRLGVALGAATVLGWALAALGGASFGPSTVGAVAGVAAGRPPVWLLAFLPGIVAGAAYAARTAGGWWWRGERPARYLGLAVGGALVGAGGWRAGGGTLGHGLSGAAQLNVSSLLVVAAAVAGVGLTGRVLRHRPSTASPGPLSGASSGG